MGEPEGKMSGAAGPQSGSGGSGSSGGSGAAGGGGPGTSDATLIDSIAATYRGAGVVARLRFIAKNKRGPTRKLAFKALLSAIKAHTLGTRLYMVRVCLLRARKRFGGTMLGSVRRRGQWVCVSFICWAFGCAACSQTHRVCCFAGVVVAPPWAPHAVLAHAVLTRCDARPCPLPEHVDGSDS